MPEENRSNLYKVLSGLTANQSGLVKALSTVSLNSRALH